ncbi:Retinoblastoma-binding protein, partial [Spiromyces aspiralis]
QRPVFSPNSGRLRPHQLFRNNRPENQGPPPPNYVCHRCGVAGHWIYECPTQTQGRPGEGGSDYSRRNEKRIRPTTGIPKSFLKP